MHRALKKPIKKLYHQHLSEKDIKAIANNVGQLLYNKIEDNLSSIEKSK